MKQKCSSETKNIKPRKLVRVDCFEYETKQGQKNQDIDIIIECWWMGKTRPLQKNNEFTENHIENKSFIIFDGKG